MMTLKQAAEERHMVRKYTPQPLGDDVVSALGARVAELNARHGLDIRLVTGEDTAIWGVMKLVAKNVRNYFVLAGDAAADLALRVGYASADLMLFAQTLGLNTWWVGGTFNRSVGHHVPGKKVVGIVAVGYGAVQGEPHKSKLPDAVSSYRGVAPQWFAEGVRFALLAPTALNRQAFRLEGEDGKVKLVYGNGPFDAVDAGIVKYHFELGAGHSSFEWA